MKKRITEEVSPFGEWLLQELARNNLNQGELAERVGVSGTTVSRWIYGRQPAGKYIDLIADALSRDYDTVATKAGYRPPNVEVDSDSATARLMPLIEKIDWMSIPGRLEEVEAQFRAMIETDKRIKAKGQQGH